MENTELLSLANYEKAMYVVAQLAMYTKILQFHGKKGAFVGCHFDFLWSKFYVLYHSRCNYNCCVSHAILLVNSLTSVDFTTQFIIT